MEYKYLIPFKLSKGVDIPKTVPVVVIKKGIIEPHSYMRNDEKDMTFYDVTNIVNKSYDAEDKVFTPGGYENDLSTYATKFLVDGNKVVEVVNQSKMQSTEGKVVHLYPTSLDVNRGVFGNYRAYIGRLCSLKSEGDIYYIVDGNDYYDISEAINIPDFMETYGNDVIELANLQDNKYISISNNKIL